MSTLAAARHKALLVALWAACLTASVTWSTAASALDYDLGARLGLNYNILSQPHDPVGAPTLLHGSMFTGTGFNLGLAARFPFLDLGGPVLAIEADLFYGYHAGTGFAAFENQKRTVSLSTHAIRVPLLLHLAGPPSETRMRVGAGVDVFAGLMSASQVVEEGMSSPVVPLETTPVTHLNLAVALGLDLNRGNFVIPFEVRVNWDPFVGKSTVERFEGYQDFDNVGQYQVAFDWQFMFMTGISWSNPF
jgi:hypothetical protein